MHCKKNDNNGAINDHVDHLYCGAPLPSWLKQRSTKRRGARNRKIANPPAPSVEFETNPLHILADAAVSLLLSGNVDVDLGERSELSVRNNETGDVLEFQETGEQKRIREIKGMGKALCLERSKLDVKNAETVICEHKETGEEKQNIGSKGTGKTLMDVKKRSMKRRRETLSSTTGSGSNEEGEGVRKKKKYGKKADFTRLGLIAPPRIPPALKDDITQIGGEDLKLVIMKQIWETDLSPHHDRFSIPRSQVGNQFLTESEESILLGIASDGHKPKLDVAVIDPSLDGRVSRLKLGKWNNSYVLCQSWNNMVAWHHETLNVGAIIQVWSFRVDGALWFALVKVHDGESVVGASDGVGASSSSGNCNDSGSSGDSNSSCLSLECN